MLLTPQMAIYHLVMTIRVGIYPKKNFKKFDHVQLLWNNPYVNVSLQDFGPKIEILVISRPAGVSICDVKPPFAGC